jgi:hypothetical protein
MGPRGTSIAQHTEDAMLNEVRMKMGEARAEREGVEQRQAIEMQTEAHFIKAKARDKRKEAREIEAEQRQRREDTEKRQARQKFAALQRSHTTDLEERVETLRDMGPLATGGAFTNRYKRDVTRKNRARNDARKKHARASSRLDAYSNSDDEPIAAEDSVPIVLKYYLEQLHAASVALPLLRSMWETPELLLAALHDMAKQSGLRDDESDEESGGEQRTEHVETLRDMGPLATAGAFTNRYKRDATRKNRARNDARKKHARASSRRDAYSNSDDEPIAAEESVPIEPWESEHSESWESVLSKPWPSGQGVYANLVWRLFVEPFKARDALQVQQLIVGKLVNDMKRLKKSVLPYAKDQGKILMQVSEEVDRVLRFVEMNTEHTSMVYTWQNVTWTLKRATENALHINSVTEFGYNGSTLDEGVLEELSYEAEDLGSYPDDELFTPEDAAGILEWRASDLNYQEILSSSSPEDALQAEKAVGELFTYGTNYNVTLPMFKCKANVRKLDAMTPEVAHRCYVVLHTDDFSAEADANIAEFKKLLASEIPGVREIKVRALGEIDSVNVIKVSLEFGGSGEVEDLFTYVTVPLAYAGPLATGGDDEPVNLLSVQTKGAGMICVIDHRFLVGEVLDAISDA